MREFVSGDGPFGVQISFIDRRNTAFLWLLQKGDRIEAYCGKLLSSLLKQEPGRVYKPCKVQHEFEKGVTHFASTADIKPLYIMFTAPDLTASKLTVCVLYAGHVRD